VRRILVERRQIRKDSWLKLFRHLVQDIKAHRADLADLASASLTPGLDPREPLLWAYCTLIAMPTTLLQDYKQLKETTADGTGIEDRIPRLRERGYAFERLDSLHQERLNWLASLVRGLDADLSQLHLGPSGERGEHWEPEEWRVPGYDAFVIPVNRGHRLRNDRGAAKRALALHAIIPTEIGEYTVRPAYYGSLRETLTAPIQDLTLGAAVFGDLKVVPRLIGETEFLLERIDSPSQCGDIKSHIEAARDDRCDILIWPELTIDKDTRQWLIDELGRTSRPFTHKPAVVVAGSWHVCCADDCYRNRSYIYDGRGDFLAHVDKRMKFEFAGRYEAIEPGTSLVVLPTEDRLIGVAICLDFCDDTIPDFHAPLDLDVILVPSMGFRSTTDSHLRHAEAMKSRVSAQVAMVQQVPRAEGIPPVEGEPVGYAFLSPIPSAQAVPEKHHLEAGYSRIPKLDEKGLEQLGPSRH
jgi:hypothetical protein